MKTTEFFDFLGVYVSTSTGKICCHKYIARIYFFYFFENWSWGIIICVIMNKWGFKYPWKMKSYFICSWNSFTDNQNTSFSITLLFCSLYDSFNPRISIIEHTRLQLSKLLLTRFWNPYTLYIVYFTKEISWVSRTQGTRKTKNFSSISLNKLPIRNKICCYTLRGHCKTMFNL